MKKIRLSILQFIIITIVIYILLKDAKKLFCYGHNLSLLKIGIESIGQDTTIDLNRGTYFVVYKCDIESNYFISLICLFLSELNPKLDRYFSSSS